MDKLEESKRELDYDIARLDEAMKAQEAAVPESWHTASESLTTEEALATAENMLTYDRRSC